MYSFTEIIINTIVLRILIITYHPTCVHYGHPFLVSKDCKNDRRLVSR